MEREAEGVAFCEEVGEAVNVGGNVVWSLGGEVREELLEGSGEDEGFGVVGRDEGVG